MNIAKLIYNLLNYEAKLVYQDSIHSEVSKAIEKINKKFTEWKEYCQKNMNIVDTYEASGSWGEQHISVYYWEGNLPLPNGEVKNGEFIAIIENGANDTGEVWASLAIYEIY